MTGHRHHGGSRRFPLEPLAADVTRDVAANRRTVLVPRTEMEAQQHTGFDNFADDLLCRAEESLLPTHDVPHGNAHFVLTLLLDSGVFGSNIVLEGQCLF
jgi:hypothetical protein